MVKLLALAALAAAGCEASLSADSVGGTVDASNNNNGNVDSSVQMQVDAAPACANGRKVFLEFLGATLTDDANSDAPTNKARWLTGVASALIPPFRQGRATRAQEITEIIDGVKQRLSMTPIEVVTVRPASGPYVMVVLGGANTNNGGTVGTIYSYATSYHDCGDLTKNDVAWVSDMTVAATGMDAPTSYVADLVMGAIGWSLGLDGTTDPNDCMCGWANGCSSAAGACTLSSNIATQILGTNETACPGQNPQNEIKAFNNDFCQ